MTHLNPERNEIEAVIRMVSEAAREYIDTVDQRPVISQRAGEATASFQRPLPETGDGAVATLQELIKEAPDAAATT
ncbi:MAG: hypothetical protein HKM98_03010, partial [Gammaproteobacteria bacterium]|nr:hypothetical protein [Gammaproteobacteria bacterium]